MIKYSVIIVVYNGETFISDCINSILKNKIDSYEIIIVDDGSYDCTKEKIMSFQNGKIRYFHMQHSGTGNSRNLGVSKSQGQYVVFLDSDDLLSSDFFTTIDDYTKQNNSDFIIFKWQSLVKSESKWILSDVSGGSSLIGMQTYIWNKVISKKIAKEIFFPSNTIYEDVAYSAQGLLRAKNVLFLDKVLYYHRTVKGSIINSVHLPNRRLDIIKGFDLLINDLTKFGDNLNRTEFYEYQALINNIMLNHMKYLIEENYYSSNFIETEKILFNNLKKYNDFFGKSMIFNNKITLNKKLLYLMIKFGVKGIVKKIVN